MTGYHPDHHFLRKWGLVIDRESGRPLIIRNNGNKCRQVFLLQELLQQEIMQMKFLLKMVDFMEISLQREIIKHLTKKLEMSKV